MGTLEHLSGTEASPEAVRAFRSAVQFQGRLLGELAHALANGCFNAISLDAGDDFECLAGARLFMVGGSLGTEGYSGRVLPQIAALRMQYLGRLAVAPQFVPPTIGSFDAGTRGAWYALPHARRRKWTKRAGEIRKRGRVPLLTAVDIGGTKIHMIVVEIQESGRLSEHPVVKCTVPTPRLSPGNFYTQLARYLCTIREVGGNYELLPLTVVGQPGRFENTRSKIGEGTALDLGDFVGVSAAECLEGCLRDLGSHECEVLTSNDGRTQQAGFLHSWSALHNQDSKLAWHLRGCPVLYFGLGTGLGSSFCTIAPQRDEFGQIKLSFLETPPLGGVAVNPAWLESQVEANGLALEVGHQVVRSTTRWRELLSGVFIRQFMTTSGFLVEATKGTTPTLN